MGNNIALDADEENFRIGLKNFNKKHEIFSISPIFIKQKIFLPLKDVQNEIILLELSYKDIQNSEKDFEEFLRILQNFYLKNEKSTEIILSVTGYHADTFTAFLQKYLKTFQTSFVFNKIKQIPSTIFGIFSKIKGSCKNFLYYFNMVQPINNIHEINSTSGLEKKYYDNENFGYPFCLVNIRGGLSFYKKKPIFIKKVEDLKTFKRLGGSIIGESTCVNLVKLATKTKNSLNSLETAELGINLGDNRNIDMTVGDIYGESLKNVLNSDIIASSLGKSPKIAEINKKSSTFDNDVIKSIYIMMAINIAQLTGLYLQNERIQKVVFASSLLRNEMFFALIQCAMQFFIPNDMLVEFYFIDEVEFLPCIGSLFIK